MVGRWIYASLYLLLTAPVAWAVQWQVDPTLSLNTDYSDNRFLSSQNAESIAYSSLNLGLQAKRETANNTMAFTPALRLSRYSSRSEYDNNVYSARVDYSHLEERQRWNLSTDVTRDTTLATAYEATGLIDRKLDRQLWHIGPSYDRNVTDRLSVAIAVDLSRLTYDRTSGTALAEYDNDRLTLATDYALQKETKVQASLAVTNLDLIGVDYRSRDYSLNLGYTKQFSEMLDGGLSVGGHRTTVDGTRLGTSYSDSSSGWLTAADIRRRLSAAEEVSLVIRRSVETSAYGGLLQKDDAKLSFKRQLNARLTTVVVLRGFKSTSLADISLDDRDFARLEGYLNWRYSPDLTVSTGYSRLYNNMRAEAGHADANMISVRVVYTSDFRAHGP